MNKTDLIGSIAKKANLSKADARKAVEALVASTTSALKKGDKVALVGFGTLLITNKKARMGRNPKTGAKLKIPAKKVVRFRAGSALSTMVK